MSSTFLAKTVSVRGYNGQCIFRISQRGASKRCKLWIAPQAGLKGSEESVSVPSPNNAGPLHTSPVMWTLIVVQGIALIGALVGGVLARKRRYELTQLSQKLRQVNAKLRQRAGEGDLVCAASDDEAALSYRQALETAIGSPSAAHPYELYGADNLSLAKARQKLSLTLKEGRTALYDGKGLAALQKSEEATSIAAELQDKRASRAVSRLRANALNTLGQYRDCLQELQSALDLSEQLKDHSQDADILGEMADSYADLGNYEQAAQVYDQCLEAIGQDYPSSPSSVWDC